MAHPIAPTRRTIRTVDLVLVVWAAVWVAIGSLVAMDMRDLRDLSDSLVFAGRTLQQAGERLTTLQDVPFLGEDLARVGEQLQEAGRRAVVNGQTSRSSIDSTSILLGVAIAGIPSLPLFGLYLPVRLSWAREVRSLRRKLQEAPDDPVFLEYLARRAIDRLPYDALREVSEHPWQDVEMGRFEALADAELRRLGLSRRAARAGAGFASAGPPGST